MLYHPPNDSVLWRMAYENGALEGQPVGLLKKFNSKIYKFSAKNFLFLKTHLPIDLQRHFCCIFEK